MILTFYERTILEVFAQAYPYSAQYLSGGRRLRRGMWEKECPRIVDDVEEKNAFLEAVEKLCGLGVISTQWKRFRQGDEVSALYLEDPVQLYSLLERETPEKIKEELVTFLETYTPAGDVDGKIVRFLLAEGREKKPLPSMAMIKNILLLASLDPEKAGQRTIRSLSVILYNNSKTLERMLKTADRVSVQGGSEKLSLSLNLERHYPETTLAGDLMLEWDDGRRWDLGGEAVTLPFASVEKLISLGTEENRRPLLIIENKETFHVYRKDRTRFSSYFYLAGQPNRADKRVLQLLRKGGVPLFFFSDLDPAGLLIFKQLYDFLDGEIIPEFMTPEIYDQWFPHGYKVSKNELKKLRECEIPRMTFLQERILETGVGIEQEVIPLGYDKKLPGEDFRGSSGS